MEVKPIMATEKINGFDKYDIRNAASTLIEAESIRNDKRKGFYETVKKEVVRKAEEAEQAAVVANIAAKEGTGLTKRAKAIRAAKKR